MDGISDYEKDELEFQLYFKTCLVERDLDILKIKLKQSIKMRQSNQKQNTGFHKTFPFYFIQPTLVSLLNCNFDLQKYEQIHNHKLITIIFQGFGWFRNSERITEQKLSDWSLAKDLKKCPYEC